MMDYADSFNNWMMWEENSLDISKFVDDLGNKILNETMSHVNKLTINES